MPPNDWQEADEAFWRKQEQRRQRLDQPCCTQSHMSWALFDTPGDFCVVVHGESDCLNCFYHHNGRNGGRFYSTRLTDNQLTTGDTQRPLKHLLRLIAEQRRPEAVIVLGTCPVEVIGDRFETAVEEVAAETGVPMVPLHTHGLALMSLTRCQDWLYASLARLPQHPGKGGANLLGVPPEGLREVREVLTALGVPINGVYPNGTSLEAWQQITSADHTFAVDPSMYPKLGRVLEQAGQPVHEVPMPVGPEGSRAFYRAIAEVFGRAEALDAVLAEREAAHQEALDALRRRAEGVRLGFCIRMLNAHRTERLAHDGLGDLPFLRSLGFDVHIFIQGPPEEGPRKQFAKQLDEQGFGDLPFDVFMGPWKLSEALASHGMQLAVMSEVVRNEVEGAGVIVIPSGSMRPFYQGIGSNLAVLGAALEAVHGR